MALATRRSRSPASEEVAAAARVVLALTLGVGAMGAAMAAAANDPIAIIGVPSAVLAFALMRHAVAVAGWAGVAIWLVLLPAASGEAMLAPLVMVALCLAVAIGPDGLLAWIGRNVAGRRAPEPRGPDGWIEEDGRPVD